MSFIHWVAGLTHRDKVRSLDMPGRLRVELLLFRVERSQLNWFGYLVRMHPGCLPGEVFQACSYMGSREHLGDLHEGLMEVWISFLKLFYS